MPNDLADVLHYFIPEAGARAPASPVHPRPTSGRIAGARRRPAALPLVALPIGDQDVVRGAFAWNLAVEIGRLGGHAALVAPQAGEPALWPDHEPGESAGTWVVPSRAAAPDELYRDALDVAVARAADAETGGLVLVRVPPLWLRAAEPGVGLLRWTLLFTSSDPVDLLETYGVAKLVDRLAGRHPGSRIGVTIHGARRLREAEEAFDRLACSASRHLGRPLTSYGLLVDDLHVYRAIVEKRAIGLVKPQSPAARSLRDVARLLLEDARERERI